MKIVPALFFVSMHNPYYCNKILYTIVLKNK